MTLFLRGASLRLRVSQYRRSFLIFLLTIFALGQALYANPASAIGGPCSFDSSTVPGTLLVSCAGPITTTSANLPAVDVLQEGIAGETIVYGGDGGNGELSLAIALQSSSVIETSGDAAHGIKAESQGGSGGSLIYSGSGANAAPGSAVTVDSTGGITTHGVASYAIFASSGGGMAGALVYSPGSGANGGAGGAVVASSSAGILTTGAESHGIYAISAGSQGGTLQYSGNGGNGGAGGEVDVQLTAGITTTGAGAHGVSAMSVGGAGGAVIYSGNGANGGAGGAITITSSGNIAAGGSDSHGIFAQSLGGEAGAIVDSGTGGAAGAGGAVSVDIQGGMVQGGSASGIGVLIIAGTTATLTNSGDISALSNDAIEALGADVTVDNSGTVTGDVTLDASNLSVFNNLANGTYNITGFSGDALVNSGVVAPGGVGAVQSSLIKGDFTQNAGGTLKIDADWTGGAMGEGDADYISVSGEVSLAGKVVVNPINFPDSKDTANTGLTRQFTILESRTSVIDNGITVMDTAAVDYALLFPDEYTVDLLATINFLGFELGKGMTSNQTAVGENLNSILSEGGAPEFVEALTALPTQGELNGALDQLSPVGEGGTFSNALSTGNTFAGQLLSCRVAGEEGDAAAYIREGQCVWARANVRRTHNDGGSSDVGFEETSTFISGGGQIDIGGPWRLGAGVGFEQTDLQTDSNASSEGDRVHVGAVLKYNPGPWLLAASITGGYGWADNERNILIGGFAATATSETDTSFIGGRLTAAYVASFGHWYLKPEIDVAATHLSRDGYSESGPGGVALDVQGNSDTVISVSPTLELGAQVALAGGGVARPFIKGGATWLDTDEFTTTANFAGAPAGVAPFAVATEVDDVVADVGAGVDLFSPSGMVLRLQYDGRFGEETREHGGTAKFSVPF